MTAAMSPAVAAAVEGDWPAPRAALDAGRALLKERASGRVIIACDHDVDGLASAVLVARAIERLGGQADVEPVNRGEHVHVASYRDRLAARAAGAYVVTDMGSRAEPIGLPAPTLLIDHHDSDAFPPDAVVVSASRRLPVVPTSYLAFELLSGLVALDDLAWLALLGTVADLGTQVDFGRVPGWRRSYRAKPVSEAVGLLNAARRSADHDVAAALAVLRAAQSPSEISDGSVPGSERLRQLRAEVAAEMARLARTPPRMHGRVALIRIRSRAQIHPLLAARWKARLAGKIVLVANDDYLPGRVNFAVRTTLPIDLIAWLKSFQLPDSGPEFARGHPAATGGSLDFRQFDALVAAMAQS